MMSNQYDKILALKEVQAKPKDVNLRGNWHGILHAIWHTGAVPAVIALWPILISRLHWLQDNGRRLGIRSQSCDRNAPMPAVRALSAFPG
jgi:hypothetical protein